MVISIPSLFDELDHFTKMFQILEEVNQHGDSVNVAFDFSKCTFLAHNAVAFVGGLARLIQHRGGEVTFLWDTLTQKVMKNLARNKFLSTFDYPKTDEVGNSIPYREDKTEDKHGLLEYLQKVWMGHGWVKVSPLLKNAVVGRVWEIYANAFEHSKSPVGIFSCGQRYPKRHELKLTAVDFGIGIPSNVRNYMKRSYDIDPRKIPAENALKWSFKEGTSTSTGGRGLGLGLLKEFVSIAKGRLEIFSNEAYCLIEKNQEKYVSRSVFFQGTLVNITLHCDEKLYYYFTHEVADKPPFQEGA